MATMNKLVFKGGAKDPVLIEIHDQNTFVQYVFNDVEEVFGTLRIMADCMAADMDGKGISFDPDYDIVCEDACASLLDKFSERQLRAIIGVLYEKDLPSDLDVLAQEIQMRMQ